MNNTPEPEQFHGSTPSGAYRLLKLLGLGPNSRTYLAEHQHQPGQPFALKIIEAATLFAEKDSLDVLQEITHTKNIFHRYVQPPQEAWTDKNVLYISKLFVEGGSLRQRLTSQRGLPLPLKEALVLLKQLGEGLQAVHEQGLVHGNIKAENILLRHNGDV